MAVQDWMKPGIGSRRSCKIATVDPANRQIEATLKDATTVQVAVFDTPGLFIWPKVGEYWTIHQREGFWMLDHRVESYEDEQKISDLKPGEGRIDADLIKTISGKDFVSVDVTNITEGASLIYSKDGWAAQSLSDALTGGVDSGKSLMFIDTSTYQPKENSLITYKGSSWIPTSSIKVDSIEISGSKLDNSFTYSTGTVTISSVNTSIVTGSGTTFNQDMVGGTIAVSSFTYQEGSVKVNGSEVTGTSTAFTADMVGGTITVASNNPLTITSYISPTKINVSNPDSINVSTNTIYIIKYTVSEDKATFNITDYVNATSIKIANSSGLAASVGATYIIKYGAKISTGLIIDDNASITVGKSSTVNFGSFETITFSDSSLIQLTDSNLNAGSSTYQATSGNIKLGNPQLNSRGIVLTTKGDISVYGDTTDIAAITATNSLTNYATMKSNGTVSVGDNKAYMALTSGGEGLIASSQNITAGAGVIVGDNKAIMRLDSSNSGEGLIASSGDITAGRDIFATRYIRSNNDITVHKITLSPATDTTMITLDAQDGNITSAGEIKASNLRIGPTARTLTAGQAVIHNNLYVEANQSITGNLDVGGYVTADNLPPSNAVFDKTTTDYTGIGTMTNLSLPYTIYYELPSDIGTVTLGAQSASNIYTIIPPSGVYWKANFYGKNNADNALIYAGVRLSSSTAITVWIANGDNTSRTVTGYLVLSGFKL